MRELLEKNRALRKQNYWFFSMFFFISCKKKQIHWEGYSSIIILSFIAQIIFIRGKILWVKFIWSTCTQELAFFIWDRNSNKKVEKFIRFITKSQLEVFCFVWEFSLLKSIFFPLKIFNFTTQNFCYISMAISKLCADNSFKKPSSLKCCNFSRYLFLIHSFLFVMCIPIILKYLLHLQLLKLVFYSK